MAKFSSTLTLGVKNTFLEFSKTPKPAFLNLLSDGRHDRSRQPVSLLCINTDNALSQPVCQTMVEPEHGKQHHESLMCDQTRSDEALWLQHECQDDHFGSRSGGSLSKDGLQDWLSLGNDRFSPARVPVDVKNTFVHFSNKPRPDFLTQLSDNRDDRFPQLAICDDFVQEEWSQPVEWRVKSSDLQSKKTSLAKKFVVPLIGSFTGEITAKQAGSHQARTFSSMKSSDGQGRVSVRYTGESKLDSPIEMYVKVGSCVSKRQSHYFDEKPTCQVKDPEVWCFKTATKDDKHIVMQLFFRKLQPSTL